MLDPDIDFIIIQNLYRNLMSRWDSENFDKNNFDAHIEEEHEARLLRKFHEYRDLQTKELEKRQVTAFKYKKRPENWISRFMISALIQIALISTLTISLTIWELMHPKVSPFDLLFTGSIMALASSCVAGAMVYFFSFLKKPNNSFLKNNFNFKTEFERL